MRKGRVQLVLVVTALATLSLLFAVLQYKWLSQLRAAELVSLQSRLRTATRQIETQFGLELSRLIVIFGEGDQFSVESNLRHWETSAPYPLILRKAVIANAAGCADSPCPLWLQLHISELATGELRDLSGLRRTELVFDEVPALAFARFRHLADSTSHRRASKIRPMVTDWVVLELDRTYLSHTFLPMLVHQYLGSDASQYGVAIVRDADYRDVIYESSRGSAQWALQAPDATGHLAYHSSMDSTYRPADDTRFFRRIVSPASNSRQATSGEGWRLLIRHQAGSIGAAVRRTQFMNFTIAGCSLLLMGTAIATLIVVTRQAQSLAKAELEFVAGFSHELRTPLTIVRSAGYNLSRGVVADWTQVRRYGEAIQTEGRRLSDLVDRAMRYAALRSGKDSIAYEHVDLSKVVEAAVAECSMAMSQVRLRVQVEAEADLPAVRGDAMAIQHCIQNILDNAAKYASRSEHVSVRLARNDREIQLSLEDYGWGLHSDELRNIFKAFYRGKNARASNAQGVGLGLTLVSRIMQAHNGRITVDSKIGKGTKFTLYFPLPESRR